MKKSRIAFTGVFDIANFGDHLFPLVFENEMEKRNLDFQIFLFSPFSGKEDFDIGRDVFSLSDMEKMHLQDPFDAIIVGGGEVVHFLQSDEKLQIGDTAFQPYPISQVWIIASLVALKYNILLSRLQFTKLLFEYIQETHRLYAFRVSKKQPNPD